MQTNTQAGQHISWTQITALFFKTNDQLKPDIQLLDHICRSEQSGEEVGRTKSTSGQNSLYRTNLKSEIVVCFFFNS